MKIFKVLSLKDMFFFVLEEVIDKSFWKYFGSWDFLIYGIDEF